VLFENVFSHFEINLKGYVEDISDVGVTSIKSAAAYFNYFKSFSFFNNSFINITLTFTCAVGVYIFF
jgi:uncharacterized membrane protein (GlpM family)